MTSITTSAGISAAPSLFTTPPVASTSATLSLLATPPVSAATAVKTSLSLEVPKTTPAPVTTAAVEPKKAEDTKSMTMTQLDNFLNIWAVEVRDSEATFHEQVAEINNWDRKLTCNGEKLLSLHATVQKLKESQANINYDLDFVACHLTELNDYLTDLEKKSDENKTFVPQGKIDQQRKQVYDQISNLDVEMKRMHVELNELIENMNQSSSITDILNPVAQIGSILNSHVASLQLVDKNIEKSQSDLTALTALKESITFYD